LWLRKYRYLIPGRGSLGVAAHGEHIYAPCCTLRVLAFSRSCYRQSPLENAPLSLSLSFSLYSRGTARRVENEVIVQPGPSICTSAAESSPSAIISRDPGRRFRSSRHRRFVSPHHPAPTCLRRKRCRFNLINVVRCESDAERSKNILSLSLSLALSDFASGNHRRRYRCRHSAILSASNRN